MSGRLLRCDKPPQFRFKPLIYFKIEKEKEEFQQQIYNTSELIK